MWRRTLLVLALLSAAPGCTATARESASPLAGTWRLDASRSDEPRRPRSGDRTDGRWDSRRDSPFPDSAFRDRGRRGMRPRLPELLRIEQSADRVRLLDSTGVVLQEIVTGAGPSNPSGDGGAPAAGSWSEGVLTVAGVRGGRVQTFTLEDEGRTLVIRTRGTREGGRGFELRRVYRREGA